jgi:hypothetical protein
LKQQSPQALSLTESSLFRAQPGFCTPKFPAASAHFGSPIRSKFPKQERRGIQSASDYIGPLAELLRVIPRFSTSQNDTAALGKLL